MISGNGLSGVVVKQAGLTQITGNWIGLDESGTKAAGNGQGDTTDGHGILLENADRNLLLNN